MNLVIDKKNENYEEIGRQFAYEGLDESYLKNASPEDLEKFRKGFEEVKNRLDRSKSDDFIMENESRMLHR